MRLFLYVAGKWKISPVHQREKKPQEGELWMKRAYYLREIIKYSNLRSVNLPEHLRRRLKINFKSCETWIRIGCMNAGTAVDFSVPKKAKKNSACERKEACYMKNFSKKRIINYC